MTTASPSGVGTIQPIGFLVALSSDWLISHVSANIDRYFDTTAPQLRGQPVASLFTENAIHDLRNQLTLMRGPGGVERLFACPLAGDKQQFDVSLHNSGGHMMIEGEPAKARRHGDITSMVRGMAGRLDQAADLPELLDEAARQVRSLTGFDRVTVQRFDPDGTSGVVAESARSGVETLLDKQASASDMAAPANDSNERPLLRFIADSEAAPVAIVAPTGKAAEPLDLRLAVLTSGSPGRLKALHRLEMRAELSLSITVGGVGWGLIVCHHQSPRRPSFEQRGIAELFALMLAMRIEISELKAVVERTRPA